VLRIAGIHVNIRDFELNGMHPVGVFEFEENVQLFPSPRILFTLDSNLLILKRLHISTVQRYSVLEKLKLGGNHKN